MIGLALMIKELAVARAGYDGFPAGNSMRGYAREEWLREPDYPHSKTGRYSLSEYYIIVERLERGEPA